MEHTLITKVVRDIETGRILSRRLRWTDKAWGRLMGIRNATAITNTFVGPLPASNTETVVLTTPPIQPCPDNSFIFLAWQAVITAGTSCTSLSYQIRRGTTTAGTVVGAGGWKQVAIATDSYVSSGFYFDLPGVVAGQQYSLTVVQGAASGAGTWQDGALIAMVL